MREGFAGKSTARCLPVSSACLGTSLPLLLFVVFYTYVFASSFRAPTLNAQQIGWEKTKKDKEVGSTKSPTTTGVGNQEEGYDQTPLIEWRVSDDEEGYDHTLTLTFLFQLFSSHLPPPAQTLLHKQA